jgi:succinate dehydrogenase / fumarate reductase, cytochrome b subunit
MQILTSSVGRKILMAITGQLMVLFVVVHLLGNSSIFIGADGINAYAKHLHDLGPLVWVFRLGMLGLISIHGIFGIMLTLENSAATPQSYAVKDHRKATFSSNNMIWTGLLIMLFLVYHLLQFTARVTPDIVQGVDALGRFDVFTMVLTSFQKGGIAAIYVAAMVVLFLHLNHGIQSFFQTMGWNTDKTLPVFSQLSKVVALVFLVGYSSIPVFILTGILSK